MQAIKCDRKDCGRYFVKGELAGAESASFSYLVYDERSQMENGYTFKYDGHFDLCPDCTAELFKWMGIERESRKPNSQNTTFTEAEPTDADGDVINPLKYASNPFAEAIGGFLRRADRNNIEEKEKKGWSW